MLGLIYGVLLVSVVIIMHEWAHYITARMLGITVTEFSIGFGMRLLGWTSRKTGTDFSVRLLPVGGYNQLLGEDDVSGRHAARRSAFVFQPAWKQALVYLAGPGVNIVFALLVCALPVIYANMTEDLTALAEEIIVQSTTVIAECDPPYHSLMADVFGLMRECLAVYIMDPMSLVTDTMGFFEALKVFGDALITTDAEQVLYVVSSVSGLMGLTNLLPIPGLDGGQLVLLGYEKLRGRRMSEKWQNRYMWIGVAVIGFLLLKPLVCDVLKLIGLL